MSSVTREPPPLAHDIDSGQVGSGQFDYRRLILPIALVVPVLILIAMTKLEPFNLDGGLMARAEITPGRGAQSIVIIASVSSLLGLLICRWARWWGLALALAPFLLIIVMGTFVWAWIPALVGQAVIIAVDDWRRAIPAWAASMAIGLIYCLTGIDALILSGPVDIRLDGPAFPVGAEYVSPGLTFTYLGLYLLVPTAVVLVAAAIGMIRRAVREHRSATAELHDALHTGSVTSERARIARDLHDVVAHHISLVAVRAESAPFVQPGLGEAAREVLARIADDARRALGELRQVLTVLERSSGDPAERAPQPGIGDIATLFEQANAAGQRVTSTGNYGQVPPTVGYVLYRVVQEALSNARRHAPGRPVEVACAGNEEAVTVTVSNPVDGRYQPGPVGRGLIGMQERVSVLGGTLETGLRDGAFVVSASLPRTPTGRPQ